MLSRFDTAFTPLWAWSGYHYLSLSIESVKNTAFLAFDRSRLAFEASNIVLTLACFSLAYENNTSLDFAQAPASPLVPTFTNQ